MSLSSADFTIRSETRTEPATVKSVATAASLTDRHVKELSPLMVRLLEEGHITPDEFDKYGAVFISATRCDVEAYSLCAEDPPVEDPATFINQQRKNAAWLMLEHIVDEYREEKYEQRDREKEWNWVCPLATLKELS